MVFKFVKKKLCISKELNQVKMEKVTILFLIAAVLVAVSAYPVEESDAAESSSPAKGTPLLAAEATHQKQNETSKIQDSNDNEDSEQNSSESTEQAYIQETFIEVLLPGIQLLNTTDLETLLNKTSNSTDDDDDRSKRSPDSDEDSSSSEEKASKHVHDKPSNKKSSSEDKSDDSSSSSSEESSKEKGDSSKDKVQSTSVGTTDASVLSTESILKSRPVREAAIRHIRSAAKSQETSLNNGPNTKTSLSQSSSNTNAQIRKDLSPRKFESSSSRHAAPAGRPASLGNVRKTREVVDSSETGSPASTTKEPVVYITPHSRLLSTSREATASVSPLAAGESLKTTSQQR